MSLGITNTPYLTIKNKCNKHSKQHHIISASTSASCHVMWHKIISINQSVSRPHRGSSKFCIPGGSSREIYRQKGGIPSIVSENVTHKRTKEEVPSTQKHATKRKRRNERQCSTTKNKLKVLGGWFKHLYVLCEDPVAANVIGTAV
eukprot:907429_1